MRLWLLAGVLMLLMILPAEGRVFFTGSNPALSSIVFPQDNLLIPGGDNISFSTSWQSFPWWGDIDEPENKPNNKYILNGERSDEQQYFAGINQLDNMVSVSRWINEHKKLRFDLTYSTRNMQAQANGEDYTYSERNAIRELYLATSLATYYRDIPVGIKFGLGGVNTSRPEVEHLVVNGTTVSKSNAILWGWDGEGNQFQDGFFAGNPLKFDLQGAATLNKYDKVGTRFRYYAGKLDHFTWNDSLEEYSITPMKMHNYTFRLYGIHNWFSRDKFRFNTTALTRLTMLDSIEDAQGDRNIPESVGRAKQFVIQVNPNVNIFPWKYPMTYIDAAILCNYQFTRYEYLHDGELMYSSIPWNVEENSGERFSYGNEQFFEMALDMYASIPVFGMKNQSAALGVSLLVWRKYKWFNKYFGSMRGDDFEPTGMRKSFYKEMWLNTFVNLIYRRGKVMYRLDFGQPLIYSLTPKTTITDADGRMIESLGKDKMWLAQSGYKVGFFVSTELKNVMRYQPFARPGI